MDGKIRERLLNFINSPKDVPLLAGFSVGFYMLLFYYSRNFNLANSLNQFLFFTVYYILLPMSAMFGGYKAMGLIKLAGYRKHFLFISIIAFFSFYLIQLNQLGFSKKLAIGIIMLAAVVLSIWLKKYYKLLILLLFFMSVFNMKPFAYFAWIAVTSSSEWKEQPDEIESLVFKLKPNIYYIQPDGYASFKNLRESPYNYENSDFELFLRDEGFTLYDNYRSNYFSTLLSNSSMFSMKHHYSAKDVDLYAARDIIVGDNPVLKILKKNHYKTFFLTEKPYLVINRPSMGYDYCNVDYSGLPYIRDGWDYDEPLLEDFMSLTINKDSGNFYFIEKMSPNHIQGFKSNSTGIAGERSKYLSRLEETNEWLKKIIRYIEAKDPDALIIIAADHGGYVGFDYTLQAYEKTTNPELVKSIFGAHLAIKWNNPAYKEYDVNLKSSVNLFRTVFSYLAQDKKYLENLQENSSYVRLNSPNGLYRYINDKGSAIFEEVDEIQD